MTTADPNWLYPECAAHPDQPCWCPDAYLASHCYVSYCPKHGERPDPDLWDHSLALFPASSS